MLNATSTHILLLTCSASGCCRFFYRCSCSPPRITKANATLKGSCNQGSGGRWLQLTADAIDLEEGRNTQLQYYWYLLLARNRNVVLSDGTSGRKLSLRVGDGPRQVQPGRSYIIKVAVVAKDGKQAISTKQQVGRVLEVPLCS